MPTGRNSELARFGLSYVLKLLMLLHPSVNLHGWITPLGLRRDPQGFVKLNSRLRL